MESVSEEEVKGVFNLLDSKRSGLIELKNLGDGLRGLGLNPSESHLDVLCRTADVDSAGRVSFKEFCKLFRECANENEVTKESLLADLGLFDRNSEGFIMVEELIDVLCRGGEALGEHQAREIIRDFAVSEGRLSVEDFVDKILAKNPLN